MYVDWQCPSCGRETRVDGKYGAVVHRCPKLGGLTTPYVRKGVVAEHRVVLREDHVGDELVQTDDQNRPVQAIVTTRDNGQDVRVFAPAARIKVRS